MQHNWWNLVNTMITIYDRVRYMKLQLSSWGEGNNNKLQL